MRVFLTSDSKSGRELVRTVLSGQGHVVAEPSELGAGALVADTEWRADAAIAVLLAGRPPQQQRAAVLVEIGVAVGRHVPTLILSKRGTQLPSLAGVPRIDADLNDVDTMALKVELFLQGVREKSPTKFPASPGRPVSPLTKGSLSVISSLELDEAVGQLLQLSGSDFIREEASPQRETADFVLHVENNESDLGLVLIEVKSVANSNDPRRRLRDASAELSGYVLNARAGLGLLVYDGAPVRVPSTPLVAAISIRELTAQLEHSTLAAVLRRARNDAIHGM